ncbi:hypothetical protein X946_5159 [Burkholderia sp. ABCPW 111]|nr:hypothetical protein X946_5159 [Burkholderia sp. ABCPW 111]
MTTAGRFRLTAREPIAIAASDAPLAPARGARGARSRPAEAGRPVGCRSRFRFGSEIFQEETTTCMTTI